MEENTLHPFEAAQRQRSLMLRVVRMAFAVIVVTVAILNAAQSTFEAGVPWWVPVLIAAFLITGGIVVDLFTPNKKISSISSVFLGILGGMLATVALGSIMDLLLQTTIPEPRALAAIQPLVTNIKVMLGITLCYLGVTTVLQTQDDFRLVIPYVEFSKVMRGPRPLLLDTSALIDARISDVAQTGIIQTPIIVPRFVVAELQILADAHDKLKRARGRRGLDVVKRLQRSALDVSVDETLVPGKAVDQMLVELARRMPATIVTTDMGLARVAEIHGIPILNLNDVANALKPALVPGETLVLRLVKPGEQPGQAVGYLDDGTMVVTDGATHRIGEDAAVMVTSTLQTSAGRLIFARLQDDAEVESSPGPEPVPGVAPPARPALAPASDTHPTDPGEADEPAPGASPATGGSGTPEPPRRTGPFPPKPPTRRPNSARNPRR
jgi:uncharacterized protein YacL